MARDRVLFGFHAKNLRRLPWSEKIAYAKTKGEREIFLVRSALGERLRRLFGRTVPPRDPLTRTQRALDEAFDAYEPQPYDGRVTLFRAARQPLGIRRDPMLGWKGVVPGLDVRVIPAYFTTGVYEPAVGDLTAELRRCLDEVDAEGAPAPTLTRAADPPAGPGPSAAPNGWAVGGQAEGRLA